MSPSSDMSWELSLESRNDVIERKSVCSKMNPSGLLSENCECISWPETVMFVPASNIRLFSLHISPKSINVEFPSCISSLIFKILFEDRSPFLACDFIINLFGSLRNLQFVNWNTFSNLDIRFKLLISFVVLMIERSSFKVNYTSASIHIVNSSSKGNLSSESVSTESSHGKLFFVHKSHDISGNFLYDTQLKNNKFNLHPYRSFRDDQSFPCFCNSITRRF
jgi:hypothetical protein